MARIMGIDYGDARVGLAFSDVTGFLVGDAYTLHERNLERVVDAIVSEVKAREVSEIVLGYPKNMDGTVGVRGEKSESLAQILKEKTSLPVILWDERRTSISAHQILSAGGLKTKKHKAKVDAVAATLILQGYLDSRR